MAGAAGGEVQAQALLSGGADELPVVREGSAVAPLQLAQHDAAGPAHAAWVRAMSKATDPPRLSLRPRARPYAPQARGLGGIGLEARAGVAGAGPDQTGHPTGGVATGLQRGPASPEAARLAGEGGSPVAAGAVRGLPQAPRIAAPQELAHTAVDGTAAD
jgi:hypothetical protein